MPRRRSSPQLNKEVLRRLTRKQTLDDWREANPGRKRGPASTKAEIFAACDEVWKKRRISKRQLIKLIVQDFKLVKRRTAEKHISSWIRGLTRREAPPGVVAARDLKILGKFGGPEAVKAWRDLPLAKRNRLLTRAQKEVKQFAKRVLALGLPPPSYTRTPADLNTNPSLAQ